MNDRRLAFQFIILLGIVSLFGDITYEGARSVIGPYLAVLGASAFVVSLISGLGEFLGYALRFISGYISDRKKAYWPMTFLGYSLLISIPLLAFSKNWQIAAILIILERTGKAIRTPPRDAILSYATKKIGRGRGFGIHEALDQIGAVTGPLVFFSIFLLQGEYRQGFMILWIPAVLTLFFLTIARLKVGLPQELEEPFTPRGCKNGKHTSGLPKIFWSYSLFISFSVLGFVNFLLVSYHFKVKAIVPDIQIPIFYALAMGIDALVALIMGRIYDLIGLRSLITIPILTLPIPFLAFSNSYSLALTSILFWGIITGIHETIMRAAVSDITPVERRGTAFGIFNTLYGISGLIGASSMGILYTISIKYLIIFILTTQFLSLPFLWLVIKISPKIQTE